MRKLKNEHSVGSNPDGSRKVITKCCGKVVDSSGYCTVSKGFVLSMLTPGLCPICSYQGRTYYVDFQGACWYCKDYMGDRFDLIDGHWKLASTAKQKKLTWDENLKHLQELKRAISAVKELSS